MKILLVEDNPKLAGTLQRLLEKENHVIDHAISLGVAKEAMRDNSYSIVLLDRCLPDGEGTDLIRFSRELGVQTRFLILSALADIDHRVEGLDLGADDYLVKPFNPDELLARVRAAERRPIPDAKKILECGNLSLNCATKNLRVAGETVVLRRSELIIIECLLNRARRVVTRAAMESAMYGFDDEVQSNTLDVHVSRLRKALAGHDSGVIVLTIRGVGYLLKEEE